MKKFDLRYTLGVESFCAWLDEHYDQSLVTPDSNYTWCFGMNKEQLSMSLRPALDEFFELTAQRLHIALLPYILLLCAQSTRVADT